MVHLLLGPKHINTFYLFLFFALNYKINYYKWLFSTWHRNCSQTYVMKPPDNMQEAKKLDGVGPVDNRPSTD